MEEAERETLEKERDRKRDAQKPSGGGNGSRGEFFLINLDDSGGVVTREGESTTAQPHCHILAFNNHEDSAS